MQGNVLEQTGGGGDKINGIIEEYKVASGGNVNAGEFVKFLNGYNNTEISNKTQITNSSYNIQIKAVKLTTQKVLVLYPIGDSSTCYLTGVVCTVTDTTISPGTPMQLSNIVNSGYKISAVALTENKVFIAHSNNAQQIYGFICTIIGEAITANTAIQIVASGFYGSYTLASIAVSDNKIFLAYNYSNKYWLWGCVCTINGTTITKGTATELASVQNSGYQISLALLSENKILIAHSQTTNYNLYGNICTINGTAITYGGNNIIDSSNYSGMYISIAAISDTHLIILHSGSTSNYYLYYRHCYINGTEITATSVFLLSNVSQSALYSMIKNLTSNTMLITYKESNIIYGKIILFR